LFICVSFYFLLFKAKIYLERKDVDPLHEKGRCHGNAELRSSGNCIPPAGITPPTKNGTEWGAEIQTNIPPWQLLRKTN
jgi:hypothetical protein